MELPNHAISKTISGLYFLLFALFAAVGCRSTVPKPQAAVPADAETFSKTPYVAAEERVYVPHPSPTPMPTPIPRPAPQPHPTPLPTPFDVAAAGGMKIENVEMKPDKTETNVPDAAVSSAHDGLPSKSTTPKGPSLGSRSRSGVAWDAYFAKGYPRMKVTPNDESATNPGFNDFIQKFRAAVLSRDETQIEPMIDTANVVSGAGESGMTAFIKHWDLAFQPRNSGLWRQLASAIDAGCAWDEQAQTFTAPAYKFGSKYAKGMLDESIYPEHQAVVSGSRVRARSAPSTSGEIVEELSNEVVKLTGPPDPKTMTEINGTSAPWFEVVTFDGKKGFVWGGFVHPLNVGKAVFKQVGGEWKLVEFSSQ